MTLDFAFEGIRFDPGVRPHPRAFVGWADVQPRDMSWGYVIDPNDPEQRKQHVLADQWIVYFADGSIKVLTDEQFEHLRFPDGYANTAQAVLSDPSPASMAEPYVEVFNHGPGAGIEVMIYAGRWTPAMMQDVERFLEEEPERPEYGETGAWVRIPAVFERASEPEIGIFPGWGLDAQRAQVLTDDQVQERAHDA